MITKDFSIFESGSGGEIEVANGDIVLAEQIYLQVYLALFGGNVDATTLGNEPVNEVKSDWWGNSLIFPDDPVHQYNSLTEKALRDNALTSVGRVNIQRAVDNDLQYLKTIADVTTNVVILSTNKVQITVNIKQLANQQNVSYQFIWDNAKNEVVTNRKI